MLGGMFGAPSEHSVLEARLKDARKKLDESKQRLEREQQQRAEAEDQHKQHKKNSVAVERRMKNNRDQFQFCFSGVCIPSSDSQMEAEIKKLQQKLAQSEEAAEKLKALRMSMETKLKATSNAKPAAKPKAAPKPIVPKTEKQREMHEELKNLHAELESVGQAAAQEEEKRRQAELEAARHEAATLAMQVQAHKEDAQLQKKKLTSTSIKHRELREQLDSHINDLSELEAKTSDEHRMHAEAHGKLAELQVAA
jgi:chromosome segregation ATPase